MEQVIVNGFKFPTDHRMRLAIAQICQYIGDRKGIPLRNWKFGVRAYSPETIEKGNSKITKMMQNWCSQPSEESPWGKIFLKVDSPGPWPTSSFTEVRIVPNEFTQQVANMIPIFMADMRKDREKNKEVKAVKQQTILTKWKELEVGDYFQLNHTVFHWSQSTLSSVGYPDTEWYEYGNGEEKRYQSRAIRNVGLRGILLGFEEITTTYNFKVKCALVQIFGRTGLSRFDPRIMIKA